MRIPNKFNGYSKDGIRLYNDPMTMAVVGGMAGAAMSPKDPLKGALLGAVGGYGGGAMLGAGAGTTAASTAGAAITPAANVATVGVEGLKQGLFAGGGNLAGMTTGIGTVPAAAPSGFMTNTMAGIGKDFDAVSKFAKENPMIAGKGFDVAQGLLSPEQQPMPQGPGIIRGQQMAQDQLPAYAMARPQISLI